MPIITRQPLLAWMLEQRCFFLFLALLALLLALAFLGDTVHARAIFTFVNVLVLLTAVAAIGRTWFVLIIAVLLGVPALAFRLLALESSLPGHLVLSWGLNAAFLAFVLGNVLHYVLRRDLMTADKLFGVVVAYILVAVLWAHLHGMLQYFYPGAYAFGGTAKALNMPELIYFSITTLTTVGFGDITPVLIPSRILTALEMIQGVMFVALLIARLTGIYVGVATKT